MKTNALCLNDTLAAKQYCDRLVYCGADSVAACDGIMTEYRPFDGCNSRNIYVHSICDEDMLADVCDYLVTTNAKAMIRASYDLNEAGIIEARHKLSPIMLLHKMGVLDNCTIAGGVCLDNDDLDLMAQQGIPLIVTPTASAGYGHGYAPVCAAMRRGIRVGIGTFDGKYNMRHDLNFELEFLRLTANAEMRTENALDEIALNKIINFE